MGEQLREAAPIYLQLMDQIRYSIVSGTRRPGERLASVRDLALEFGVNPNTVQRALSELEREGLLYSERTAGRYVTGDVERIRGLREQMAVEMAATFLRDMKRIGYSAEEVTELLGKLLVECERGDGTWTA